MKEIQVLGIHRSDCGVVSVISNEDIYYAENIHGRLLDLEYYNRIIKV